MLPCSETRLALIGSKLPPPQGGEERMAGLMGVAPQGG
jgi:hypothetical protein